MPASPALLPWTPSSGTCPLSVRHSVLLGTTTSLILPGDTKPLSPLFPTLHSPAPKNQHGCSTTIPNATPAGQKSPHHPKVTLCSSSPFFCQHPPHHCCRGTALFLCSPEPLSFSRCFSRMPLRAGSSWDVATLHGQPQHPQLTGLGAHTSTQRISILQPQHEFSAQGGTFPLYFTGQNQEGDSFAAHHRLWTMHKPHPVPAETPSPAKLGSAPLQASEKLQNTRHRSDWPRWTSASRAQQPQPPPHCCGILQCLVRAQPSPQPPRLQGPNTSFSAKFG